MKQPGLNLKNLQNFTFGFTQVFLVSCQTWFIAKSYWPGLAVCGFLISFVWTLNVRSMAFGGWMDRVIYSTGAMMGALTGVLIGGLIIT